MALVLLEKRQVYCPAFQRDGRASFTCLDLPKECWTCWSQSTVHIFRNNARAHEQDETIDTYNAAWNLARV